MNNVVTPVILGIDFGCYSIARTFNETLGIKSVVFSYINSWIAKTSKIIINIITSKETIIKDLITYAKTKEGKKLLFGASELYIQLILENRLLLEKYYVIPYTDIKTFKNIINKSNFYNLCKKLNIEYPETIIINKKNYKTIKRPFSFPIILKANDSTKFNYVKIKNKRKVYILYSVYELNIALQNIYSSSYDDTMLLQEYISGDDNYLYTLTCYCNKKSEIVGSCLGKIIASEHAVNKIGNYYSIVPVKTDKKLLIKVSSFLKEIKYQGIANFDLKLYNDKYYFFEINPRLGRSNYYNIVGNVNYVEFLLKEYFDLNISNQIEHKNSFYSLITKHTIKKINRTGYIENKNKKLINPLLYKKDLSLLRILYIAGFLYKENKRNEQVRDQ